MAISSRLSWPFSIIWQSADGKAEDMKERTIGVAFFGCTPTYDTGEDAIVRVTASDVRKRLVQHYSGAGKVSEFRIHLPSGGYVPELIRVPRLGVDLMAQHLPIEENQVELSGAEPASRDVSNHGPRFDWKYWLFPVLGIAAMTLGIALSIMNWPWRTVTPGDHAWGSSSAPWAALFDGFRNLVVVASDPDIAEIQRISHSSLSLSDCANQLYLPPGTSNLSPSEVSLMKEMLRGDKISVFDGSIIANDSRPRKAPSESSAELPREGRTDR